MFLYMASKRRGFEFIYIYIYMNRSVKCKLIDSTANSHVSMLVQLYSGLFIRTKSKQRLVND